MRNSYIYLYHHTSSKVKTIIFATNTLQYEMVKLNMSKGDFQEANLLKTKFSV